jgi:archaellum component FlaC
MASTFEAENDGVLEFMVDGYGDYAEELRGQIAELDQTIEELESELGLVERRIDQIRAEQARRKVL